MIAHKNCGGEIKAVEEQTWHCTLDDNGEIDDSVS